MAPTGTGGSPSEKLSSAIDASFGSMDDFKAEFDSVPVRCFLSSQRPTPLPTPPPQLKLLFASEAGSAFRKCRFRCILLTLRWVFLSVRVPELQKER